jgi:opacity protein-like surface antigen
MRKNLFHGSRLICAVEAFFMRLLIGGLLAVCALSPALAGDLDLSWLRGSAQPTADPPNYMRWSGFYVGGQAGVDFHGLDFRNVVGEYISTIAGMDANFAGIPLSNFPRLSTEVQSGPSYGGFFGYNYQIDDVVVGFEVNLNRSTMNGAMSDMESHNYFITTSGGSWLSKYNLTTSGDAQLNDYGTLRARFGWAYGSFLPYVFGGVSLSQIDSSRSVNVSYCGGIVPSNPSNCVYQGTPPTPPSSPGGNYTQSEQSHGKWITGFDVGLGIDYAMTRNLFLRGELEYLQLGSPSDIKINTASMRVGAGVKF